MIIARVENLIAGKPVDDALSRAFAYVLAGAEWIMIHSKEKSGTDVKEFYQRFRIKNSLIPLVVVPTTYNQFKEEELRALGINIVIYTNHMLRASYPVMYKIARLYLSVGDLWKQILIVCR